MIKKRLHVRVEHVSKSASRQSFLERVDENDKKRAQAKEQKSLFWGEGGEIGKD